jgi:uncharacterized protein (DUF488 family)
MIKMKIVQMSTPDKKVRQSASIVYTIGHSTRKLSEFIQILKDYSIDYVVDIRPVAKSRHNPQFNSAHLEKILKKHDIYYYHFTQLGGFRHVQKDSVNLAWHNESFRGFADYMQTQEFKDAIKMLLKAVNKYHVVLMCAEAVPWRCHRSLIGDALMVRDIEVIDIFDEHHSKPHVLTSWAQVEGTDITYP